MVDPTVTSRFNEIYDSTSKTILSFVTAKCRNTADIQDIVQDTYVELYKLLDKRGVDYIKNDNAIVLRIARQKLHRYYSLLERLRMFLPMTVTNEDGDEANLPDMEANAFLEEDFMTNHVLLEDVKRCIQCKPQDVKKVFYLYYGAGLSLREVAQALSMSESNVKNKLYRTLAELRTLLQER